MVRINRVKVSASKSRLTSIRRPLASNTSKARLLSALPLRRLRATFTSTSRSHSPCPPASLRRLFNARCNVLSAKPWLLQNSTCRCPLASNSVTRRLISWLPRRFRTLTSSLSVMPRVDQNRAGVPRWVRLTDTLRLKLDWRAKAEDEDDSIVLYQPFDTAEKYLSERLAPLFASAIQIAP